MGIDLALRASLVWNGEVMNDLVLDRPEPIVIGSSGKTTFVTPDIGLPPEFAIVRPASSGYMLVLAAGMRGRVCVGGEQRSVEDVVGTEDFHALAIAEGDWGVVELSDSCRLFFQFVPREEHAVIATKAQIKIGAAGFGAFSLAGSVLWAVKGIDFGEAIARGIGVTALMFGLAWLARAISRQDGESQASLGFSIALHTAILLLTFHIYSQQTAMAALSPQNDLTASYTVTRPADAAPILVALPKSLPTVGEITPSAAVTVTQPEPVAKPTPTASGGGLGRAGGRQGGDPISKFGILGNPSLRAVMAHQVGEEVGTLTGVPGSGHEETGTPGNGQPGTRGDGKDPKKPAGKLVKTTTTTEIKVRGGICMGTCGGVPPVTVDPPPTATEDGPTLNMKEVDEIVRRRQGFYRACYQKKLNANPDLSGTVVVRFTIRGGAVTTSKVLASGTLKDPEVGQCILTGISSLQFPPRGSAVVTYPFAFAVGG